MNEHHRPTPFEVSAHDGTKSFLSLKWDANSGVFYVTWTPPNRNRTTKRVPCSIQDAQGAMVWLRGWWLECTRTGLASATPKVIAPTLRNQWANWESYVATKRGASPDAKQEAKSLGEMHVFVHSIADVPVAKWTNAMWAEYVEWMPTRTNARNPDGYAPFTVRNILAGVRRMIDDSIGHGWFPDATPNPLKNDYVSGLLEKPESLSGGDVIHFSDDEVRCMLLHGDTGLDARRHILNVTGVCSGLRLGELCGLKWSDIPNDRINVDRQLTRKGSFKPPKKKSHRVVPVHPRLREALDAWHEEWATYVGRPPRADDPVFPNRDGAFVYDANGFTKTLIVYRIDPLHHGTHPTTGQPKTFNRSFHALRRSFATMLTNAGVPEADVKALMGHAASNVTRKHYVAKDFERLRKAIALLPLTESTLDDVIVEQKANVA